MSSNALELNLLFEAFSFRDAVKVEKKCYVRASFSPHQLGGRFYVDEEHPVALCVNGRFGRNELRNSGAQGVCVVINLTSHSDAGGNGLLTTVTRRSGVTVDENSGKCFNDFINLELD